MKGSTNVKNWAFFWTFASDYNPEREKNFSRKNSAPIHFSMCNIHTREDICMTVLTNGPNER